MSLKKQFVIDTNVILHDSDCIYKFEENDVIIPIPVLEELDNFKKGSDTINFHAREFLRSLDELSSDCLFNGGLTIGEGLGKIKVVLEPKFHGDLLRNFSMSKVDHKVLNIAYTLLKENKHKTILVSKDVNLRMKAKSLRLMAEDYKHDHIEDIQTLYTGSRTIENLDSEVIEKLYNDGIESSVFEGDFYPNEYLILRNGSQSGLGVYNNYDNLIKKIGKRKAYEISPRNAEQTFAIDALLNDDIELVTISGKAGTGKTLLALAGALEQKRKFRQIFMSRPIVPLSNKDVGFLPGDIQSKLDPYMQPLYDNLGVLQMNESRDGKSKKIKDLLEDEKLVVTPLSYIRGRSLVKVYFIIDEAQNLTPHEIKTIITRAGEGTKMIFTGDIFQIDHPYLDVHSNGLSYLIEKMKGQELYAHINLEKGERSKLSELASNLL